jgi:hypothetical protein
MYDKNDIKFTEPKLVLDLTASLSACSLFEIIIIIIIIIKVRNKNNVEEVRKKIMLIKQSRHDLVFINLFD